MNLSFDQVLVSELKPIRSSSYWGKKFSSWREVYETALDIQFYSPTDGKATISVQTENGAELESIKVDTKKGINVYTYHLTFSNNKELKAKKAENDAYYLPKGKFNIEVVFEGKSSKQILEIK